MKKSVRTLFSLLFLVLFFLIELKAQKEIGFTYSKSIESYVTKNNSKKFYNSSPSYRMGVIFRHSFKKYYSAKIGLNYYNYIIKRSDYFELHQLPDYTARHHGLEIPMEFGVKIFIIETGQQFVNITGGYAMSHTLFTDWMSTPPNPAPSKDDQILIGNWAHHLKIGCEFDIPVFRNTHLLIGPEYRKIFFHDGFNRQSLGIQSHLVFQKK